MPPDSLPIGEDAPAKINLALHVVGKRADGYHLIESLVVFTRYGDRVSVAAAGADHMSIDGPFRSGLTADKDNLVVRARDTARAAIGDGPPVSIHLTKNLPIASGVGGGSSNAAATLKALNRLWDAGLTETRLAEIGLPLGADLPMCVAARPLIARGVGERIEPVAGMPELPVVLVNPGVAVSTPAVFRELNSPDHGPLPALPERLDFAGLLDWLGATSNDLQPPAIQIAPAIDTALTALKTYGAAFARMSGSGATCFGLYPRQEEAYRAAIAIRERHPGWFVVATTTMA